MNQILSKSLPVFLFGAMATCAPVAHAQMPDTVAAPGEMLVTTVHAEGVQIYECKADTSGKLTWQFREPVATLLENGRTVGVHYAGPHWQMADGSAVLGKVAGRAPGASAQDIPLLKLDVASRYGVGRLSDVTTVQRLNTRGGVADGTCTTAGLFLNVPYSADYAFLRKAP